MAQKPFLRPLDALGSLVEVMLPGLGGWHELRGAAAVGHEAGRAAIAQVRGFRFRAAVAGRAPIGELVYDLSAWTPTAWLARALLRAQRRNDTITLRHTFYGEELVSYPEPGSEFPMSWANRGQVSVAMQGYTPAEIVAGLPDGVTRPLGFATANAMSSHIPLRLGDGVAMERVAALMEWWASSGSVYDVLVLRGPDHAGLRGDRFAPVLDPLLLMQVEGLELEDDGTVNQG